MADEPDNIVLVYLRRLDEKLDRMAGYIGEMKTSLTNIEALMGQIELRLDRRENRFDRIDKHLDLSDVAH
jgi:hypothetical protein